MAGLEGLTRDCHTAGPCPGRAPRRCDRGIHISDEPADRARGAAQVSKMQAEGQHLGSHWKPGRCSCPQVWQPTAGDASPNLFRLARTPGLQPSQRRGDASEAQKSWNGS